MNSKEERARQAETENSLVKTYAEITGVTEQCARGVLIHLDTVAHAQKEDAQAPEEKAPEKKPQA